MVDDSFLRSDDSAEQPGSSPDTDPAPWHIGRLIWAAAAIALLLTLAVLSVPLMQQGRARTTIQAAGGTFELADESLVPIPVDFPLSEYLVPVSAIDLDDIPIEPPTWNAVLRVAGPQLQTVWLDRTGTTDGQLAELISRAPGLTWLTVVGSRLTDASLADLANCPELSRLAIDSPQFTPAWFDRLPVLKELTSLDLQDVEISHPFIEKMNRYSKLEMLTISRVRFPVDPDPDPESLPSPHPTLQMLSLDETSLRPEDLRLLGSWHGLRGLHISATKFPATGCDVLTGMPHLEELTLYDCRITDECVSELAGCRQLTSLTLWDSTIDGSCLPALGQLPKLASIDLDGTRITAASLKPLADYPALTTLDLSNTALDDAAVVQLVQCRKLTRLSLGGTRISAVGVRQLQQKLPSCSIEHDYPEP